VGRVGWSHLRSGLARSLALLLGMFLAATAFTVLTAASRTAQIRTVGTVSAHFQPAYDILVRPAGARTRLEDQTGTVQPDFLAGISGGITMAQYHQIQRVAGVQVAAPIAMVGYSLLHTDVSFSLPAADYARAGRQLYRITTTWVSDGGTNRIAQPAGYLYVTPDKVTTASATGNTIEDLPGGRHVTVCPQLQPAAGHPFGVTAQGGSSCWSKADGYGPGYGPAAAPPQYTAVWTVPVLIAAVDPVAEAKLDGLDHALVSGRYLAEDARDRPDGPVIDEFPVLAASSPGMDETAVTQLQQLASPGSPPVISAPWLAREALVPGQTIAIQRSTVQQAYQQVLRTLSPKSAERIGSDAYWNVGPVGYRRAADGVLSPIAVRNSPGVWFFGDLSITGMDNADTQYRKLTAHGPEDGDFNGDIAAPLLVGTFSPAKVRSFDPLSQVPLGAYQPLAVKAASAASRRALHGQALLPNQNLGGLVTQPVDLITSLSALPALHNTGYYGSNLPIADPISVIRVRVAGVTGPNAVSLERIKEVAQQIAVSTHLDVDIVAGSSPEPVTIDLPAGRYGQPALTLSEGWIRKGVAVTILAAVDRSSLVLFVLILIVCALFVANSATAAVRGRRRELGVLACLGWTRSRLFGAVLGELVAIGLIAGLLAAAASLPAAALLGLHASAGRALLAVPAAVAVALVAGAPPAWLAARADPVTAVRPPVLGVRRGHPPGGVTAMAMRNVARTPGRALVGTVSLAVGISALTLLTAVSFAFRGVVVGSLLGDAVAVQVRSVDYIAVVVTVVLGILAVADVVFLNIAERAAEFATLRAVGWGEPALSRLVITEGTVIGLTGSLAGAALGLAGAAEFTGQLPAGLCLLAAAACLAGTAITATAAFLPARTLNRLPTARLLAEE
jgi:putative ABC transport system permease protein